MSNTHHYDLRVVPHEGYVAVSLHPPGGFAPPLAEVQADTAELALRMIASEVTFPTWDTIVTVNGRLAEPGIVPGGSSPNGHYVGRAVVYTALEYGWLDPDAEQAANDYHSGYHDPKWKYSETWHEIVSDAEDYLNEVTVHGLWLWTDGDFRLVATATCPDCGELTDRDEPGTCPDHPWWD